MGNILRLSKARSAQYATTISKSLTVDYVSNITESDSDLNQMKMHAISIFLKKDTLLQCNYWKQQVSRLCTKYQPKQEITSCFSFNNENL